MTGCGSHTLRGWLMRDSIGDMFGCEAKATLAFALSGLRPGLVSQAFP